MYVKCVYIYIYIYITTKKRESFKSNSIIYTKFVHITFIKSELLLLILLHEIIISIVEEHTSPRDHPRIVISTILNIIMSSFQEIRNPIIVFSVARPEVVIKVPTRTRMRGVGLTKL